MIERVRAVYGTCWTYGIGEEPVPVGNNHLDLFPKATITINLSPEQTLPDYTTHMQTTQTSTEHTTPVHQSTHMQTTQSTSSSIQFTNLQTKSIPAQFSKSESPQITTKSDQITPVFEIQPTNASILTKFETDQIISQNSTQTSSMQLSITTTPLPDNESPKIMSASVFQGFSNLEVGLIAIGIGIGIFISIFCIVCFFCISKTKYVLEMWILKKRVQNATKQRGKKRSHELIQLDTIPDSPSTPSRLPPPPPPPPLPPAGPPLPPRPSIALITIEETSLSRSETGARPKVRPESNIVLLPTPPTPPPRAFEVMEIEEVIYFNFAFLFFHYLKILKFK